ncbi:Structural maintenance of chromosomes protein 1, partial [Coemansia javaensis]
TDMGQLIQLELENFKSYRGRQVIGPFSGFTAVVGPNGAGKSNLMDAISFVLGVRSAHLRSQQLRDLVYRGRAVGDGDGDDGDGDGGVDEAGDQRTRRAWVRAVYEDGGGRRITFQRSITAGGDSEFRINDRVVSQHAYNQTLEGQNILVKAKNFLVFQGDVEAVAAQSPRDLARLVEQISGSWELQGEYGELEKQQDAAAERLTFAYNKKRAVAAEVQSILEQKKELDVYESKQQQRAKLTAEHMLHRLFVAEARADAARQAMDELGEGGGGGGGGAAHTTAQLDAALQSQRRAQAKAYKAVSRQERQIKLAEQRIEARQPQLAGLGEKAAHAERRAQQVGESARGAQGDAERQGAAVAALEAERARVERAAGEFEAQQGARAAQHGEDVMREFARLSEQLRGECADDTRQRDAQDRQVQLLGEAARRAADRAAAVERQLDGVAAAERAYAQQQAAAAADAAAAERALQQAAREADQARGEQARLARVEAELNEKLAGVLGELAQARAAQRETAREARLRDMVAALQRVFPGVHGRLAELCRPTQQRYDAGVATVLGRHMDAIVVDRQATAIECIAYIKEQRAGQATFLPLDALQPPAPPSDSVRHAHRGARLATDVLQYDAAVEAAVMHACGGALVCDSLAVARHLCYERGLDVKAVTLDGTVIHRSGLITGGGGGSGGGAGRRAAAQAWDAAAVDGLRKARDRLADELQAVARERRRAAKQAAVDERLAGLQARHRAAREALDALARRAQGLAAERAHAEKRLAECRPAAAQAAAELDRAAAARAQTAARIHAAAEPIFAAFCRRVGVASLAEFERQLLPATEAADERRLQFRTQLARLDGQLAFERRQRDEAAAKHARLQQAAQAARDALAALQADLARGQAEMAALVAQLGALRGELAALNAKYGDATGGVDEARHSLERGRRELDALGKELAARGAELDRALADRAAVLRRCKIEDIPLPLLRGSLQALPLDAAPPAAAAAAAAADADPRLSQLSLGDTTQASLAAAADGDDIAPDYSALPAAARAGAPAAVDQRYADDLARLALEIDALNPNPHARERLDAARARLHAIEAEHSAARAAARDARAAFQAVRRRRHDAFMRCYAHLAAAIDHAYKALTQSPLFPLGGTAYLALEDPESPYLAGIKYHAMPPLKRFRDMDQLSGGEKTVAALALLFSLQSFRPAPFFVLDEVDAALDLANVVKLANFLRDSAPPHPPAQPGGADGDGSGGDDDGASPRYSLRPGARAHRPPPATDAPAPGAASQFIVISLKQALFERARSLVGIYRDQAQNSSQVLTLDLERFAA